jgi:serine/threonine protein kinase
VSEGELVSGVRVGAVLAGKYRVDRVVGQGGMGVVVAAHHLQLETRVAIKFLVTSMVRNEESVARFSREARAVVRIVSEHVARVLDVGTLENGSPYIVMEFLEGADLSTRIRNGGPLPTSEAVELLLQASEAIAEAHSLGIVHRDLKPANLFCTQRPDGLPCVKVLDFGISKVTSVPGSAPEASMTRTSALMGTPLYMSPEQMASPRTVDFRTDIWGLGVILHEMLAGAPPFVGETLPEVCMQIATADAPRLRTLRPEAPPQLEAAILRCLEKDRNRRFPSVADFAAALMPFGPDRARRSIDRIVRTFDRARSGSIARAPEITGPVAGPTPARALETLSALGYTRPGWQPSRRVAQIGGGFAAVALSASLLVLLANRRGREAAATPAVGALSAEAAPAPSPVSAPSVAAPPVLNAISDPTSLLPTPRADVSDGTSQAAGTSRPSESPRVPARSPLHGRSVASGPATIRESPPMTPRQGSDGPAPGPGKVADPFSALKPM